MKRPTNAPQPLAVVLAKGNPGKGRLNVDEPRSPQLVGCPSPPADLTEDAAKIWMEEAPKFAAMRTLSDVDLRILKNACRKQALADRFATAAERKPVSARVAQEYWAALKGWDQAERCWTALGATQRGRAGMKAAKEPTKSKWAGLIAAP